MRHQQRGEITRAHILDAAQECFARHGYDATGVAEICQRAQVSKGAFYHHFPSKQAVFVELLGQWLTLLDAQLSAIRAGATNVPEGLLSMASMARGIFQAAGGQLPIFLEFWSRAARDPTIWEATNEPYRRYRDFFAGVIKAGMAESSLASVDPDMAARVIVSMAVGLILQGLLDPDGADWGEVMQEGVRILLDGLRMTDRKDKMKERKEVSE